MGGMLWDHHVECNDQRRFVAQPSWKMPQEKPVAKNGAITMGRVRPVEGSLTSSTICWLPLTLNPPGRLSLAGSWLKQPLIRVPIFFWKLCSTTYIGLQNIFDKQKTIYIHTHTPRKISYIDLALQTGGQKSGKTKITSQPLALEGLSMSIIELVRALQPVVSQVNLL